jgi:hypothetical protein
MGKSNYLRGAASPLQLTSYDGSGQCVHPDVIRIDRAFYDRDLLMVMEPYPNADEWFENPSLLASNDGLHWLVPEAISNPVVEPPPHRGAWNSDGDLVISPDGRLFLYYRHNSGKGESTLLRKETEDGVYWSGPQIIFTVAISGSFASPALVRCGDRFHMYYVDTVEQCVKLATSKDGSRWGGARTLFSFKDAWHIDATRSGDWFYVLLNDKKSLYLLRTADQRNWLIFYEGAWRNYPGLDHEARCCGPPILGPSETSWDNALIYRSTLLIENDMLRLWYGAKSADNVWRVGYTDGPLHG